MGKHCPFENAMIRCFVSPLFRVPPRYHKKKSLCVNIGAFWTVGKQWENKKGYFHKGKGQGRNDFLLLVLLKYISEPTLDLYI